MLTGLDYVLIALAALVAGLVNALAGGGTLISFPMLVFVGLPPVAANVTNTVALCPGYLGATLAQSNDLRGQTRRLWWAVPAGVIGGIIGALVLLNTGERVFQQLVPYLILLASGLLAVQDPVRRWLQRRTTQAGAPNGGPACRLDWLRSTVAISGPG
ncbi:MAG: sulfite exporter TauE/SafE family protein [Anaerolineae bacterium]|nr:sulfite exporter TauE/SafE family protein [Anaerolineae bacterium]